MRKSFNDYGLVRVKGFDLGGRPRKLDKWAMDRLLEFLEEKPAAYLDEMAYFLLDELDHEVSEATIARALRTARWSRQKMKRFAAQRDVNLRNYWVANVLSHYRADQIVCLDECAIRRPALPFVPSYLHRLLIVSAGVKGDRKYGWGPLSISPSITMTLKRSERWSIQLALTIDGYMD